LEQLGVDWTVRLGGMKPVRVVGGEVVALHRAGVPLPAYPGGEQLLLANGDRIPGRLLRLVDGRLHFAAKIGPDQELTLPLSAVAVIWLAAPAGPENPSLVRRRLKGEQRNRDAILLKNGDSVEGVLTVLDEQALRLEVDRKVVEVKRDRVSAVALNTDLARTLRPRGPFAQLILSNGCRLSVASAPCADGQTLLARTPFRAAVQVRLDQVVALNLFQARAVYLSDLKPRRYDFTPYFGARWPFVVDGSVAGGDLCLGGSTYDKGLGMHSQSRLTFDLGGGFRRFEALVGLDDQSGQGGSVRVQVLVDGRPADLGWDQDLTARSGPRRVRVNVAGGRELTLVVDFGHGGDVQDHVNWGDARLVR
jgi:hypothetical protein